MNFIKSHWITALFIVLFLPSLFLLSRFHAIKLHHHAAHKVDAFLSQAELTEYDKMAESKHAVKAQTPPTTMTIKA